MGAKHQNAQRAQICALYGIQDISKKYNLSLYKAPISLKSMEVRRVRLKKMKNSPHFFLWMCDLLSLRKQRKIFYIVTSWTKMPKSTMETLIT